MQCGNSELGVGELCWRVMIGDQDVVDEAIQALATFGRGTATLISLARAGGEPNERTRALLAKLAVTGRQ
jgi:hypothetical protein